MGRKFTWYDRDTTRQNDAKSKGRETHICIKREKKIPKECFAKLFRSMKNGERDKVINWEKEKEGEIEKEIELEIKYREVETREI